MTNNEVAMFFGLGKALVSVCVTLYVLLLLTRFVKAHEQMSARLLEISRRAAEK